MLSHASKAIAVALITGFFGLIVAPSNAATIVNLDSRLIGELGVGTPVTLALTAGDYTVTPVSSSSTPGALFTAWSAWAVNGGCGLNGLCDQGFLNGYRVNTLDDPDVTVWDNLVYQTEASAFANAISYNFTLLTAGTVDFYLIDGAGLLGDNRGGVSLSVAASTIPVPAALPLFLSAIGGLGLIGWRRRKAA